MESKTRDKKIGIGIVGMGFMGLTHFQGARRLQGGKVAAIVTTDPRKAHGDFRDVRGNFGAGGVQVDLKGVRVHPTLDSLLADDRVDLVDVCLPSFLHATTALRALRAGKHVLVEKPVALRPSDASRMLRAAKKAGRLLMVAQVLKFFPHFALIHDALKDGRWGRLLALHMRRRIAAPDWGAQSWFGDPAKSGGMVVDLHIHDTDFIIHLFGKPGAVSSHGLVRGGRVDFLRTVYRYGATGAPLISSEAGWINASGLPFAHGYDAFFEDATCHFDSARSGEPVLYGKQGRRVHSLGERDAFHDELQAAVNAVRSGKVPSRLSAESAAVSLEVCRAEEKAARTGKTVIL